MLENIIIIIKIIMIILSLIFPCTSLFVALSTFQINLYFMSTFFFNILIYSLLFYIFYKKMTEKTKESCWIFFIIVVFFNLIRFFIDLTLNKKHFESKK